VKTPGYLLVHSFKWLRDTLKCKTYHLEAVFVFLILMGVTLYSDQGWVEYIGAVAVFFAFIHATIAEYLREAEASRCQITPPISKGCHHKLPFYLYAKELCWFTYFVLIGAYSAIAGVIIFLIYQPWRRLWRKYNPI